MFVRFNTIVLYDCVEVLYLLTMAYLLNCGLSVSTCKEVRPITEQTTAISFVVTSCVLHICYSPMLNASDMINNPKEENRGFK